VYRVIELVILKSVPMEIQSIQDIICKSVTLVLVLEEGTDDIHGATFAEMGMDSISALELVQLLRNNTFPWCTFHIHLFVIDFHV
jgi:accessory colonization factor AcfC